MTCQQKKLSGIRRSRKDMAKESDRYVVARQRCGCVASALFHPLEDDESLREFIKDCLESDYIIDSRPDTQTVGAEKCTQHQPTAPAIGRYE